VSTHGTPPGERTDAGHGGGLAGAVRTGWVIFLALALLTLVEYIIAVSLEANLPIIIAIAVLKAGLIAYYFMHIVRAWSGGEEEA
jgi:heme/copper-type cytochrome/quinol oxidase subunit 4